LEESRSCSRPPSRRTIEPNEPTPETSGKKQLWKEGSSIYFRRSPSESSCEIERNTSTANTPSIRYAIIKCPCHATAQHLMCTPHTSRANLLSLIFAASASRCRLLLRIILECVVCVLPRHAGFSLQLPDLRLANGPTQNIAGSSGDIGVREGNDRSRLSKTTPAKQFGSALSCRAATAFRCEWTRRLRSPPACRRRHSISRARRNGSAILKPGLEYPK
jgi:hypothetical protein